MAYAAVGILWVPWLPIFLRQRQQVCEAWWSGPLTIRQISAVVNQLVLPFEALHFTDVRDIAVALVCVLVFAALAFRGRRGEWAVLSLSVLPFSMIVGGRELAIPGHWQPEGSAARFREAFGMPLDYVVQAYTVRSKR